MKYRFSSEARADVLEAKAFIGRDSKKKRNDFANAVEHAIHSLLEFPFRGSPYELQTRRIMLSGFDYAMIYIPEGNVIQIVAVWHHSRNPDGWHEQYAETAKANRSDRSRSRQATWSRHTGGEMEKGSAGMTLAEVSAAALALSRRDQIALMYAIQDNVYPAVDLEELAEARWILQEIRAGRMKTIPAEEVLEELDRIAEWGWQDLAPDFKAEIARRVGEIESGTAKTRPAANVFADMSARRNARIQAAGNDTVE